MYSLLIDKLSLRLRLRLRFLINTLALFEFFRVKLLCVLFNLPQNGSLKM